MTITRIGNKLYGTGTELTTSSEKLYFTVGAHDDVKIVIKNTGAQSITVTTVYAWSDPENPLGRVSARPSATADTVDTITFVSPVTAGSAEVAYLANSKTFTHVEIDVESAASTTTGSVYLVGRVH